MRAVEVSEKEAIAQMSEDVGQRTYQLHIQSSVACRTFNAAGLAHLLGRTVMDRTLAGGMSVTPRVRYLITGVL